MKDKWTATVNVSGDSREKVIEGLQAAIREMSLNHVLGVLHGGEGYTYLIDLKKSESQGER
jgi:hypothetical protein